jgi:hypothetical protein
MIMNTLENTPDHKLAAIELQAAFKKTGISVEIRGGYLDKDLEGWEHYAFNILFKNGQKQASFDWKQGTGHVIKNNYGTIMPKNPNPGEVLARICAESLDCKESFEEWADAFGYDADSRKAESIYQACKRHEEKLARLGLDSETVQNLADLSNRL